MKIITLTLILFVCFACNVSDCNDIKFPISDHLLNQADKYGYEYCNLINRSLNKDREAIIEISLLEFKSSYISEHGATLIEIIDSIGEREFNLKIVDLSRKERKKIYYNIRSGFDYTQNPKYSNNSLDESFPETLKILQE